MQILKIMIFILQEAELVGVSTCSGVEMELRTIFKWIVKYSIRTLEISENNMQSVPNSNFPHLFQMQPPN
jgi:hypothetical protein